MSGITSPPPFIKDEPNDLHFNNDGNNQQYLHNLNDQQYGSWNGQHGHIDPQDINMNGQRGYGTSNNMSSSFIAGNSGVTDDDLLGSLDLGNPTPSGGNMHAHHPGQNFPTPNSMPRQQPGFGQNYSHTPDGAPINSPFVNGFDFSQWNAASQNNGPHMVGPVPSTRSGFATERTSSMSRSPMTPMTPGMSNLQIGTPDSSSFPRGGQSMPVNSMAQHRKSSSQQWGSLDSGFSYIDSPLGSPSAPQHAQISEVLKSGSSVPHPGGHKTRPSIEDKKARRRASHNEVERKRRNNINNQITILSKLVPPHRLEDDNIRRALASNTSLPPSVTGEGLGLSPPQATSLLAGGQGRRAAGGITQGLPIDDRDKIPAKGDVLNSSVGWTKDLMWLLNRMMQREDILQETIQSLGGQAPIQVTEEENRMRTELLDAFSRNTVSDFEYSRRHGTGLWVPGHTNPAGEATTGDATSDVSADLPQHGSIAGVSNLNSTENQFWGYPNDNDLKEEDEFNINMEM